MCYIICSNKSSYNKTFRGHVPSTCPFLRSKKEMLSMKQYVDIILLLILILGMIGGYKRGIISQFSWFIGIVIGIFAYPIFSPVVKTLFTDFGVMDILQEQTVTGDSQLIDSGYAYIAPYLLNLFVFVVIMVITRVIINLLFNVSDAVNSIGVFKVVNGTGGAILGICQFTIALWLMLYAVNAGSVYGLNLNPDDIISSSKILTYANETNVLPSIIEKYI